MKIPPKGGNEYDMASERYRRKWQRNNRFSYKSIKRSYNRRVRRTIRSDVEEFA